MARAISLQCFLLLLGLSGTAVALTHSEILVKVRPSLTPEVREMLDFIEADPFLKVDDLSNEQRLERMLGRLLENKNYRHMLIADLRRRMSSAKPQTYEFPCKPFNVSKKAQTVHELTPYDIQVVGAMGDSITAGNGIDAKTIVGVLLQYRYKSFSIGGYKNFEAAPTLPNILRKYNPNVVGASTGICRTNRACANLNMAVPGRTARDMAAQARELIDVMQERPDIDFKNDWKVITIFIGQNDICNQYCKYPQVYSAKTYRNRLQDALDILYRYMPRTLVNLVTMVDAYLCSELNVGTLCSLIHLIECPCAAFWPLHTTGKNLNEEYQKETLNLVNSGLYDGRDDFAVVVQPSFQDTQLPRTANGTVDLSYFAPDCFHFSATGHAEAAKALWNSMIEPVGSKKTSWHFGEPYECPSQERPYFFTKKNSNL